MSDAYTAEERIEMHSEAADRFRPVTIAAEFLRDLVKESTFSLEESGGCDHGVGICACALKLAIREARIALGEITVERPTVEELEAEPHA